MKIVAMGTHLTQLDKKVIKTMLANKWQHAKTPRKRYHLVERDKVIITSREANVFGKVADKKHVCEFLILQ